MDKTQTPQTFYFLFRIVIYFLTYKTDVFPFVYFDKFRVFTVDFRRCTVGVYRRVSVSCSDKPSGDTPLRMSEECFTSLWTRWKDLWKPVRTKLCVSETFFLWNIHLMFVSETFLLWNIHVIVLKMLKENKCELWFFLTVSYFDIYKFLI